MARTSEFSKTPEGRSGDGGQLPEGGSGIQGLDAFSGVKNISPKDLWVDGGIPFPRVLLVKFKEFVV